MIDPPSKQELIVRQEILHASLPQYVRVCGCLDGKHATDGSVPYATLEAECRILPSVCKCVNHRNVNPTMQNHHLVSTWREGDWKVVRIMEELTTKGGTIFKGGEFTIARRYQGDNWWESYATDRSYCVSVNPSIVEVID